MDPFSIAAGAIGVSDVCFRLAKFIKDVRQGFLKTERDLDDLATEVADLAELSKWIYEIFDPVAKGPDDNEHVLSTQAQQLILRRLQGCLEAVAALESILSEVFDVGSTSAQNRWDMWRRYRKQQSENETFSRLRKRLVSQAGNLQLSLTALNLVYSRHASIPDKQIPGNEHFDTPQAVSSIFTGFVTQLESLHRSLFEEPQSTTSQKRFVIHGPPGSGKTEFCCKFASENKHRFWGVFWIDATSAELAEQSFKNLAYIGKVEQNLAAVKSWLSSQSRPWLLILDNADEMGFDVARYYPDGSQGVVIITTRNGILNSQGTVGAKSFEFGRLNDDESMELLFSASREEDRSPETLEKARALCEQLEHLPLALIMAGATILTRMWSLDEYLEYYNDSSRRTQAMISMGAHRGEYTAIHKSYDGLYNTLMAEKTQSADDALELLKVMAFLHPRRIREAFFLLAIKNPSLEALEQRRASDELQGKVRESSQLSWSDSLRKVTLRLLFLLSDLGSRPALPKFLSESGTSLTIDRNIAEGRVRSALKELYNAKLIFPSPDNHDDSYSMHPAVHQWVRDRMPMIGDQAVWCHVASNVIARAILMPPLGDKDEDQLLKRDLLPHVQSVQRIESSLRQRIQERAHLGRCAWRLGPRIDRSQSLQLVKFSLVYKQGGLLKEAESMQYKVLDLARRLLGPHHATTISLNLLMADTLWHQSRGEDASRLLEDVLMDSTKGRGEDDLYTLRVMDAYASSLWVQGRIMDAKVQSKKALDGLTKILGREHTTTLKAMMHHGRVIGKCLMLTEAITLNLAAWKGLSAQLGPHHLDTLDAQDTLAMAYFDRAAHGYSSRAGTSEALDMNCALTYEQGVYNERLCRLGKGHYLTLWSGLNLARIKGLQGDVTEALSIWQSGHDIAEPVFGKTHFVVLFARLHRGRILTYAKRHEEAEREFLFVVNSYPETRVAHPDRLMALFSLIKTQKLLGRNATDIKNLERELKAGARNLFGEDHPWISHLAENLLLPDQAASSPLSV
ncbi:hypothetical protein TI39_contig346g00004 [Zymoseptoria brevis]|uniref:ATPase AAA-type core domain-containing protein n=1 Tax=Zymoseptoria brevis TaxID=1047168 RepID=A0A0F4GSE9_9PEZI|nr:hypothetical protein TI39_contig346g00004 [Zymoseptoria brevis]